MEEKEFLRIITEFTRGKDFMLNPDETRVVLIVKGVIRNEKEHGMRFCPCRTRDGTWERDLELLCPCNFFEQKTWKEKGECWCGLFVKQ